VPVAAAARVLRRGPASSESSRLQRDDRKICGPLRRSFSNTSQEVVYDIDSRQDVFAHSDLSLRHLPSNPLWR
jgi:hypothetical protein